MTDPITAEDRAAARMTMDYEALITAQPTGHDTVQGPKDVPPPPRQAQAITYLRPDARTYKRDDRGRFGSGGGGGVDHHAAIKAAGTAEEVASALETALTDTMGHSVSVTFKGMDTGLAREAAEGLLQGAERFPDARLSGIYTYGSGAGKSNMGDNMARLHPDASAVTQAHGVMEDHKFVVNSNIYFNTGPSSDPEAYRAGRVRSKEEGFLSTDSATGTALHEFGHVIENQTSTKRDAYDAAVAMAEKAGATPTAYIRREVSSYATESMGEFAAEAFADVMANGAKASSVSRAAFDVMDTKYRESK